MKHAVVGLALVALLTASASRAQSVSELQAEGRGYWTQAKATGAPPKVSGCLSAVAARRIIGLQSAAVTSDQAAWLTSWVQGVQAYDRAQSSWRTQQAAVDATGDSPVDNAAAKAGLAARARLDDAVRAAAAAPVDLSPDARAIHDSLLAQAVCHTDEANTRWLKTVVQERGWPDRKRYGPDADHEAALLVLHAQNDVAWQRDALMLVRGLLDTDATDPVNVAVLADRISVLQGRAQRFGTQGGCTGPGRWQAEMIESPEEIDDRRAELGMPSLTDAAAKLGQGCK